MITYINVHCPYCFTKLDISKDSLAEYRSTRCSNCNEQFNVFTIYRWLYDHIQSAKYSADSYVHCLGTSFDIKYSNQDERAAINDFFTHNNFNNLFGKIILDCVIYGISLLEWERSTDSTIRIANVDPAFTDIWITGDTLNLQLFNGGKDFDSNKFIYFVGGSGENLRHPDLGSSIYSLWVQDWYNLEGQYASNTLSSRLKSYIDSRLLAINNDRENIESVMDRKIFPLVLRKHWMTKNFPHFTISGS